MKNIVLRGGVDQILPKALATPGKLEDCYNYEVGRDIGYTSIQGFEAFDGRMSPSTRDIWDMDVLNVVFGTRPAVNENMSWVKGSKSGDLGVVISVTIGDTATTIRFAYWNATDRLPTDAVVTGDSSGSTFTNGSGNDLITFKALQDVATDVGDYFDQLYAASEILRSAIQPVPGSGPVSGIKWYKNQQQAVRDFYKFGFIAGNTAEPQVGQHVVIIDGDAGSVVGSEGILRSIAVNSGSFGGSNGTGFVIIDPLTTTFTFGVELSGGFANKLLCLAEIHFSSGSTEPVKDDVLTGQTSGNTFTVYRVDLKSGVWADGTAEGTIYASASPAVMTAAELLDNGVDTNVLTFDDARYSAASSILTYSSTDNAGHNLAGMYRSSRAGWAKVDLGYEIRFTGGEIEPIPVQSGADTSTQSVSITDWAVATAQRDMAGWDPTAGAELEAVDTAAGALVFPTSEIGSGYIKESGAHFAVYDFDISLPNGSRVVGIEIEITTFINDNTIDAAIVHLEPYTNDPVVTEGGTIPGIIAKRQALGELDDSGTLVAYTFGGENDLWGGAITKSVVESSNFGVKLKFEWNDGATYANIQIDYIRMRVHYVDLGAMIYFWQPSQAADYTSARLVSMNIEQGEWNPFPSQTVDILDDDDTAYSVVVAYSNEDPGNVSGTMQIYELGKQQIPTTGIEIRDAAGGTGNLIADLDGNESLSSLPGSALVAAANAKYQMISENVFAKDDMEAIYGVSGAGRGFSYDGSYLRFISSGISPDLDKPRHVELFQFRLWLAFGWGEMAISVAGDPLSYDGTLNAVATGFGRPITGLSILPGKTMAVFTDQSTYAVKVVGGDFDQQNISRKNGAIEYSVQNVGSTPVFADQRGISTHLPVDGASDFEADRESHSIHPWLLDRLQGLRHDKVRDDSLVASTTARIKSQYRMYFADGYRMTMTIFGGDQAPEFTFQQLYTDGDPDQYIKVLATDADVDDDKRDRLFFTMDINPDYDHGTDLGYVYEDDRGSSFNGSEYKRWVELSGISGAGIHVNTTWSTWHLYGLSHGWSALQLTTEKNLAHPLDPDDSTEDENYSLAFGASGNAVVTKSTAYYDKGKLQVKGRHVNIRLQNESDRELPHTLQNITLVEEKQARTER